MKPEDFPAYVQLTAPGKRNVELYIYDKQGKPMAVAATLVMQLHCRGYVGAEKIPAECLSMPEHDYYLGAPQ